MLTGQTARQRAGTQHDRVTGGDGTGNVILTIDSQLQALAKQLLDDKGYSGSISVVDVQTGAVLAMYSNPTYDPNVLSQLDYDAARDARTALLAADGNPLLANAYQDRFMPGSTFKVITTATGLESGLIDLSSTWPNESQWVPPQTSRPIRNYGGRDCGGDMPEVFFRSCNIPFPSCRSMASTGSRRHRGVGSADDPIDLPRLRHLQEASTVDRTCRTWRCGFGQQDDTNGTATWRWWRRPSPTTT